MSQSADAAPLATDIPKRYFSSLVRWYWPYLRPHRGLLVVSSLAMIVVLFTQAVIPLVTSDILTPPVGGARSLITLAVLIIVEISVGNVGERVAYTLSVRSAADLRLRVFGALLSTRYLQQPRLFRSSVVGRHTSDVDHMATAVEQTIMAGLPGVLQVAVSLVLLTYVDVRSGIAMAVVTIGFLIARARVGSTMLARDRARLDANSAVGELVDETITMSVSTAGLGLQGWLRTRFRARVITLEEATYRQSQAVNRLSSIANTAGLLGLFIVMAFASVIGQQQIALVAAALLYITTIVSGLSRLPPWVRELQLAVISRRRIDQVLQGAPDSPAVREALDRGSWRELAEQGVPATGFVGLVTSPGLEDDFVLTALTGTDDEDAWRVSLVGTVVRCEGVRPEVLFVPDEPVAFNVSVRDHFRAVAPEIGNARIDDLLSDVGLDNLASLPGGLDAPIGPTGSGLTSHERARLMIAVALAARPRVLLLGHLPPLADIDTAAPLLAAIRRSACETVVIVVKTAEMAAGMDQMMYVTPRSIRVGTHTELLAASQDYSRLWSGRLLTDYVDLAALGISDDPSAGLHSRLVTEHFNAGEVIYRQGDLADRILFIISGQVEISVADGGEQPRRVAVLTPGNHCGDLHLTADETRAETAVALDECVVRSLSRGAYTAGVMGLLDRSEIQRRVLTELLRHGSCTRFELAARLPVEDPAEIEATVDVLLREGALSERQGQLRVVHHRRSQSGMDDIFNKLLDL